MAFNFMAASLHPKPTSFPPATPCLIPRHKHLLRSFSSSSSASSLSCCRTYARSERTEGGIKEEDPPAAFSGSLSSTRTQLDLLEELTSASSTNDDGYQSDGSSQKLTIREQLVQLAGDSDDDFSIPLGKNLKKVGAKLLSISQRRNIKRQAYLNEVSGRNDSVFFATIGGFVILPPFIILGIAILTGYVQLFP
ncbi:hypothetical protein SLEP1_g34414 [Rubroshorea leprosula]|uniref:Uncharacterized protein n=1 Tax=Rubroshorea leprosula TaxID=152421 RepID=A0AAV5KJU0_9ROSI|nr:hypothetical protein SLEP1_g34414 [Rubroshorea leprosula]